MSNLTDYMKKVPLLFPVSFLFTSLGDDLLYEQVLRDSNLKIIVLWF